LLHSRLGRVPVPLQRMPPVLPQGYLLILAGDLAGASWTQTACPPVGQSGAGYIRLRTRIKQPVTREILGPTRAARES
jgi:hypothetical protein